MSCPVSVPQRHVHGRSIALALAAFVAAALLAILGSPSPALADDEAAETPGETPQLVEPAFEEIDADAAEEDDMVALAASVTDQPLWEATRTENLGQVRALSRSKDLVIILGVCVPGAAGYDSTQYLVDKIKEEHYDALASASFCGKNNSVLVLVRDEKSSVINGFVKSHKANMTKGYVFGGTGSVSAASMKALQAATK